MISRINGTVRVVLVDGFALSREGLTRILESDESIQVVAQAASLQEALDTLESIATDLVVIDHALPDSDAIGLIRLIREQGLTARVLLLSAHADERRVAEAFRAGVDGYVPKTCSARDLLMAVQELAQGGSYVHPHVAGVVLNRLRGRSDSLAVDEQLSERERSVLGLATNGLNTASIARHLGLSVSTVKSHLRVIYRKLGVSDRTQAVVWALKQGFGHEGL